MPEQLPGDQLRYDYVLFEPAVGYLRLPCPANRFHAVRSGVKVGSPLTSDAEYQLLCPH